MKIESQVCSLEQAKRLKELGVAQIGFFMSWFDKEAIYRFNEDRTENYVLNDVQCSRFTVAELGVMIGRGTKGADYHWQWLNACVNSGLSGTCAYNPVALAGHIITQLENGTLTAGECNQRLNS